MEIVEKRKKLRNKVIKKAFNWVAKLPFKTTAFLIGSYAKGDFNLWSDVDVLVLSKKFKGNPLERLKALDIPPGFQIIPLNLNEFKKLLNKKNPIVMDAFNFGIVLRDDFKLVERLNKLKEG